MSQAENGTKGMHRREILLVLTLRQKGRCGICHCDLGELETRNVDHIIPRSKGGTDRMGNLQAAHIECNRRKADRLIAVYSRKKRRWITEAGSLNGDYNKV